MALPYAVPTSLSLSLCVCLFVPIDIDATPRSSKLHCVCTTRHSVQSCTGVKYRCVLHNTHNPSKLPPRVQLTSHPSDPIRPSVPRVFFSYQSLLLRFCFRFRANAADPRDLGSVEGGIWVHISNGSIVIVFVFVFVILLALVLVLETILLLSSYALIIGG